MCYSDIGREEFYKKLIQSIRKKFHSTLFTRCAKAVSGFEMIGDNDKVAILVEGSFNCVLIYKILEELRNHGRVNYDIKMVCIGDGLKEVTPHTPVSMAISEIIRDELQYISMELDINGSDNDTSAVNSIVSKLYELGYNKIALSDCYDDVVNTAFANMMYRGRFGSLVPKKSWGNAEMIWPLYNVHQEDINHFINYNDLVETANAWWECFDSHLFEEIKIVTREEKDRAQKLISQMGEYNSFAQGNIYKSLENINLNTVISYEKNNQIYTFHDWY